MEANLLYQSAFRLQAIQDHWEEKAKDLRDALLNNRRLWTIFLTSVSNAENPLPKEIRENVANLGLFVINHTLAVEADPRSQSTGILRQAWQDDEITGRTKGARRASDSNVASHWQRPMQVGPR